jgi:hypothetical protein
MSPPLVSYGRACTHATIGAGTAAGVELAPCLYPFLDSVVFPKGVRLPPVTPPSPNASTHSSGADQVDAEDGERRAPTRLGAPCRSR